MQGLEWDSSALGVSWEGSPLINPGHSCETVLKLLPVAWKLLGPPMWLTAERPKDALLSREHLNVVRWHSVLPFPPHTPPLLY